MVTTIGMLRRLIREEVQGSDLRALKKADALAARRQDASDDERDDVDGLTAPGPRNGGGSA